MLMLFEEGIHSGICTAIRYYAVANNKYMKNYDSTKKSIYLMYVDTNNLYTDMLWVKNYVLIILNLRQIFQYLLKIVLKITMSNTGYLLVVDVIYPTNLDKEHRDLPFYPIEVKLTKLISYFAL